MKRLICVWLILALLAGVGCANAAREEDPARLAVNLQAVKAALDRNDLVYHYVEDTDAFWLEFNLECVMASCTVWFIVYDDGVLIQADYDLEPDAARLDELAKYLMYRNSDMLIGAYYIDYADLYTGWEMYLYTDVNAPTQNSLDYGLALALTMLESCGGRVYDVLMNGMTAQEAIRADEAAQ